MPVSSLASSCATTAGSVSDPLISIIDDDDSLRTALIGLVRSMGFEASGFASAEAFLATDMRAACIVTDVQMPGLSGIELKAELIRRGVGTPVIMITARTDPGLEQRARAEGAACFLKKPFDAADLVRCIETAIAGGPAV